MITADTPGCCVDRLYAERNPDHPGAAALRRLGCTPTTCMQLPEGQTCSDCVHVRRCTTLFGAKPDNTTCDFFPRRFAAATTS